MTRRQSPQQDDSSPFDKAGAHVIDTSLEDEASTSYLEYAYSVINSRALPDARDGLKPVHRRILYSMNESGLRPDHAYVKSARVVGDCMGKFHPHGDSAIYDAMVRLGQSFAVNTPLIDGHGNFGSPNDSPAAMRYTEARMSPFASLMVEGLDEDTVNMVPNYDGSMQEPEVLPAAYPFLLVNGAAGIAVGMATKMIPHNFAESIAAARLLIKKPDATLEDLMKLVPGPDLPTGGTLIGLDQVKEAYSTGKGTIRIRATATVGALEGSRGRSVITITELPYEVGTERVIEAIKTEIDKKRLVGISDVKDLSDRLHGTRLTIECKTGVNAQALLAELYRLTPLEVSFGIANLALVDGQPQMLGLKRILEVFLHHRFDVIRRRTEYRKRKAEARQHIVQGLLIALDNIDEVVKIIRSSKNTAEAKETLIARFVLSDIQATHILDMPLRRLVALEVESLRQEDAELTAAIEGYEEILADEAKLHAVVDQELANLLKQHPSPRRTVLLDGDLKEILAATAPAGPLEVADEPCRVILSSHGLLVRTPVSSEETGEAKRRGSRARYDTIASQVPATTRGQFLAITNRGRAIKCDVLSIPPLPTGSGLVSARGGVTAKEALPLAHDEVVVGLAPVGDAGEGGIGVAMGTKLGVVKVCAPDWPTRSDEFEIIGLKEGDEVVHAQWLTEPESRLAFISSDGQLLNFPSASVRPQGRTGGGMAGIRMSDDHRVIAFAVVPPESEQLVATYTGKSAKVTPFDAYPGKGRGTGGVRCHRFLKGEDKIVHAWIGTRPAASGEKGEGVELPDIDKRRDGSGTPQDAFTHIGNLIDY